MCTFCAYVWHMVICHTSGQVILNEKLQPQDRSFQFRLDHCNRLYTDTEISLTFLGVGRVHFILVDQFRLNLSRQKPETVYGN